jgi:hypothetical protein
MNSPVRLLAVLLCLSQTACDPATVGGHEPAARADPGTLAAPGARLPRLVAAPDGDLWMSWVSPLDDGTHALRYSVLGDDGWSAPVEIARGRDWFVNWADFPSVLPLRDGGAAAHWLVRSGAATYAYDVVVAVSEDGRAWTSPVRLHDDRSPTEHGFVTLFRDGAGAGAVWLDGRNMAAGGGHDGHGTDAAGAMTLRVGRIGPDGRVSDDGVLDPRTCDCCQTGAAMTAVGPVVVYRDRSEDEVRDIRIVSRREHAWGAPRRVAEDDWRIAACPVNGPAVAARQSAVAVAWFTAAGDTPRVRVAFSADAGARFGAPIDLATGSLSGRVGVVLLDGGAAIVSWVATGSDGAEIRYRRVGPDASPGVVQTIARVDATRSAGFPQMALAGDLLVFAWTRPGPDAGVMTATVPVPR